jgi:hypothetical protein
MSYRYTPADERSALDARIHAAIEIEARKPDASVAQLQLLRRLSVALYRAGSNPHTVRAELDANSVARYPKAAVEFPDFDQASFPDLGAGWADSSWCNEGCPSFIHEGKGLSLFVDYVDPAQRDETQDCPRFSVRYLYGVRPDWQFSGFADDGLISSDDWATIVEAVASIPDTKARAMPQGVTG